MFRSKYGGYFDKDRALLVASIPALVPAIFFDLTLLSAPGWFDLPTLHSWLSPFYVGGINAAGSWLPTFPASILYAMLWPVWVTIGMIAALYVLFWLCYKVSRKTSRLE